MTGPKLCYIGPRKIFLLELALSLALLVLAPVEWNWEAPPSCPDQATVETRFLSIAPELCLQARDEPLQAQARATQVDGEWRLALELRRGSSTLTRSLSARSCEALAEAAAVIAATACPDLSQDPPDEAREPATSIPETPPEIPASVPEPPAPPISPPVVDVIDVIEVPAVAKIPARRNGPVPWFGGRAAVAFGPGPAPAALLGLAVQLRWPRFLVNTAIDGAPRRRVSIAHPGPAIDVRVAAVSVTGCPRLGLGARQRGHLAICGGLEGGVMTGTGVGTPVVRTAVSPWLAVVAGSQLAVDVHPRVMLGLEAELAASLLRPAFILEGYDFGVRASSVPVRVRAVFLLRFL